MQAQGVAAAAPAAGGGNLHEPAADAVGPPGRLKLSWDWTLAGDDEQVPIADRPEAQAVFATADPTEAIERWVRLQATIVARLSRIYEVVLIASDSDEEVAELRAINEHNRMSGARSFAEHLSSLGALKSDLMVDRATDIIGVLMDPVPAGRLVHDAAWSMDDYCAWQIEIHRVVLLGR